MTTNALHRLRVDRFRRPSPAVAQFTLNVAAIAGALVTAGQVLWWSSIGAWPFHDTATNYLAGMHLRSGEPVYTSLLGTFLSFVYAPPWAVLWALLSLLPFELVAICEFAAQVLALRYVAGSWRVAGLLCWLPFVPRALVTGNVDLLIAAALYAAVLGIRGSGYAGALFTFAKFSPILAVRRWREFIVASLVLVAITLPWAFLWPSWANLIVASIGVPTDSLPFLPRIPFVLLLLALRRPWARAAAAALATPAFYFHSAVLLFPAARLLVESALANSKPDSVDRPAPAETGAQA